MRFFGGAVVLGVVVAANANVQDHCIKSCQSRFANQGKWVEFYEKSINKACMNYYHRAAPEMRACTLAWETNAPKFCTEGCSSNKAGVYMQNSRSAADARAICKKFQGGSHSGPLAYEACMAGIEGAISQADIGVEIRKEVLEHCSSETTNPVQPQQPVKQVQAEASATLTQAGSAKVQEPVKIEAVKATPPEAAAPAVAVGVTPESPKPAETAAEPALVGSDTALVVTAAGIEQAVVEPRKLRRSRNKDNA